MFLLAWAYLLLSTVFANRSVNDSPGSDESRAATYLENLNREYTKACNEEMTSRWIYITNVTESNEADSVAAQNNYLHFQAKVQQEIIDQFPNWKEFKDESIRREFQFLSIRGPGKMNPVLVKEMNALSTKMESAYASATVCAYNDPTNCTLRLEPEISEKLRTVTNFDELAYYWTAWHDAMSKAVPSSEYARFIELQNIMAKANGYDNMGDLWAAPYDDGTTDWTAKHFETEMLDTWEQLRPMYNILHAYVRMKLRKNPEFGNKITENGLLPANIFGNMWAQDWSVLEAKTKPYSEISSLDATDAMLEANYTPLKIFQVADKFFENLGLIKMNKNFWEKSMIERPPDTEVVCHASAEDFCLPDDFRIKMCTIVNQDDLVTVHHEMGHIQYFMQYSGLHYIFRDGANPGFHEAIGDSLALAVTTPYHLKCVLKFNITVPGLACDAKKSDGEPVITKTDINFLYFMALQKFAFFPFSISMDSWRWGVFDGSIPESEYNRRWWEIREMNQGIAPPTPRPNNSFDPSAKYHIVANVEYIRYFVSFILQFQFYEAMCISAGEYNPNDPTTKPLYQCDFDSSKEAGKKFEDMMRLGFSKPWPEALRLLTGSPKLNTKSLLNYFDPLFKYMGKELSENGETVGFGKDYKYNPN